MSNFMPQGVLTDNRAESMIHHYSVMLFDDFQNDAKVFHIENRLRDLLRNYDESIRWNNKDIRVLKDDRRWALYKDKQMAENDPEE